MSRRASACSGRSAFGRRPTRVAASHIRVGTFQFVAARRDETALRSLADYVIGRHYPEAAEADNPYLALLNLVIRAQARLVAIGFRSASSMEL